VHAQEQEQEEAHAQEQAQEEAHAQEEAQASMALGTCIDGGSLVRRTTVLVIMSSVDHGNKATVSLNHSNPNKWISCAVVPVRVVVRRHRASHRWLAILRVQH
jgi:hypothetical protein